MTLRTNSPRAKRRWIGLGIVVVALVTLAANAAFGHGTSTIPPNFFTVADQQGVNDVNSEQVDLTQFGRDDSDATKYKLFWSWDSHDSWAGNGQTGDACALFDNDTDGKINFAICARVQNLGANVEDVRLLPQNATQPVYSFTCSDAKNDRCAQPTAPLPSTLAQVDAGVIGTLAKANLITETDPFPAGEDSPHDTTLEVDVLKTFIPGTEVLVNVCSYPSAGNGGNNNPFDCIVNPGGGFLTIVKDAGAGVTSPTFSFSVNTSPATTRSTAGSGTATTIPLLITFSPTVTETSIPSPWALQTASCKLADGTTATGTFDAANNRVSGILIQSGLVTTCTFVDRIPNGTLVVIKHVINDNGGTATAGQFTYNLGDGSSATAETGLESPGRSYSRAINTAYNVTENTGGPSGYTVSYSSDCNSTISSGSKTCTITNNDDAATLTITKHVINDNGGNRVASEWSLDSGGTNDSPDNFAGAESPGTTVTLDAGSYNVTETGPSDYTASYSADCSGTIANGASKTCTVTNNDKAASLTIIKHVINDNGGTQVASAWSLDSGGTNDSPDNFAGAESPGTVVTLDAGSYDVTETGPSGYTASYSADCTGAIANGGSKTCTVTNNDNAATLTIIKHVINDNGGTEVASAWSLDSGGSNDSPDDFAGSESGTVVSLSAGSYDVTETGPSGYAASYSADCSGTIANGESKTCTVTNNDLKASPGIGTTMEWTLDDSVSLSGFRTGGTGGTATFRLYKDDAACGAGSLVFTSSAIAVDNSDGTASTTTGYTTADSGTYRWVVAYSGNDFNNPITSTCGSEVTTLP
jgi:hypothetical protein